MLPEEPLIFDRDAKTKLGFKQLLANVPSW